MKIDSRAHTLEEEHRRLELLRKSGAHVPKSYGIIKTEKCGEVLVKEYIDGENLEKLLHGGTLLSVQDARKIVAQLVDTLLVLKRNGFFPVDLTDENIILTTNGLIPYLIDVKELATSPEEEIRAVGNLRHGPLASLLMMVKEEERESEGYGILEAISASIASQDIRTLEEVHGRLS